MYSKKVEAFLRKNKVKTGDGINISKGEKNFSGLLLPQTESGDRDTLVIKLKNGYNIGIKFEADVRVKKAGTRIDLGKVQENLHLRFRKDKPPVALVATGGTIASRVNYITGGVINVPGSAGFLYNVPELRDIAKISVSSPVSKMSEDMDYLDWQEIARDVVKRLNSEARGVMVSHGTDTLHYTSAALSFMVRNLGKPVVLIGAQRSTDRGSSDSGFNLICGAWSALSDIAEVGVCMHGTTEDSFCLLIRGTKVKKLHSSRRDAFRPVNELPLAKIYHDGKIEIINKYRKKRDDSLKAELDAKFNPRVALIKVFPSSDPDVLNYYWSKGYRGFVLEGTGMGHVPTSARRSWIETVRKLAKDGVSVVITSQTVYGKVNPSVYTNLRKLRDAGAIHAEDMLSETAFVKLGWVLAKARSAEDVRKLMLTNIAGEISKRQEPEAFLY